MSVDVGVMVPVSSARAVPAGPDEPTANPSAKVLIAPLTGVRAVAATWVVVGHFSLALAALFPSFGSLNWLWHSGYLGVDLFFVLSGFILAHNYLHAFPTITPGGYARFLWLRVARMYPVHLFTLLLLLAGITAGGWLGLRLNMPGRMGVSDLVRNLFMVHAWGFSPDVSWNGPAWSISAEWFAYLLFPVVALLVCRIRTVRAAWTGVALMYGMLLGYFGATGYSITTLSNDGALVRVITQFIAGCLLYRIYRSGWAERLAWHWVSAALVGGVVAFVWICPPAQGLSLYPAPLLAVLVLALARSRGGVSRLLSSRTMVFWGEASYALYMTHDIVRMVLGKLLPAAKFIDRSLAVRGGVTLAYAIAIAASAVATYLIVEKPARAWMRSLVRSPRAKQPLSVEVPAPALQPVA